MLRAAPADTLLVADGTAGVVLPDLDSARWLIGSPAAATLILVDLDGARAADPIEARGLNRARAVSFARSILPPAPHPSLPVSLATLLADDAADPVALATALDAIA